MRGGDLLAHHVAADRILGEKNDEGVRRAELAVDLRDPVEADPDLLVEEDAEPPRLEVRVEPLRELFIARDVPVAEEDLAHRIFSILAEASAQRWERARRQES